MPRFINLLLQLSLTVLLSSSADGSVVQLHVQDITMQVPCENQFQSLSQRVT